MANLPRRVISTAPTRAIPTRVSGQAAPSNRFSPFKEIGASGVAIYAGRVITRERGALVSGPQRWLTYADMVSNISVVAAGVRYFLNIIAGAKFTVKPKEEDSSEHEDVAEFVQSVIDDMDTPWRRVARRQASYRFMGFGIHEWTAKRREEDNKIGLQDIESRPQHTIERWEVDDKGGVLGVWQRSPQDGRELYLPRRKVVYLVDDTLTDSPEGMGLYRHLVEPVERLKKYLLLEGQGFERDLRGVPIGRVPYSAVKAAVTAGAMTEEEGKAVLRAVEDFVLTQSRKEDTSIVMDSAPYVVTNDSGKSISGIYQYGIELLQGQSSDFGSVANAVERLNREIARILGVEHLLLGGEGGANRALSEDKSRNFYQVVNGTLDDICSSANKDVITPICDLNGIDKELRPKLTHSDISFRSVQEVTAALRDMSTAGAPLAPDDPAINDVRDMLGIERAPKPSPEVLGLHNNPITSMQEKQKVDLENKANAKAQQQGAASDAAPEDKPPVPVKKRRKTK